MLYSTLWVGSFARSEAWTYLNWPCPSQRVSWFSISSSALPYGSWDWLYILSQERQHQAHPSNPTSICHITTTSLVPASPVFLIIDITAAAGAAPRPYAPYHLCCTRCPPLGPRCRPPRPRRCAPVRARRPCPCAPGGRCGLRRPRKATPPRWRRAGRHPVTRRTCRQAPCHRRRRTRRGGDHRGVGE